MNFIVIQAPDERLRAVCAPVGAFDDALALFVERLIETRRAYNGVGLAAPQVGRLIRVVSINPGQTIGHGVMINPTVVAHGRNKTAADEGCLSIRYGKRFFRVARWDTIAVQFQNLKGETKEAMARGLAARILQHEIDHLDGKLIGATQ